MQVYRKISIEPLVILAVLMPFFDWSEDLISIGGYFYLNIYKLYFLFALVYVLINGKGIRKGLFNQIIGLLTLGFLFILYHNSFDNIKGFFFVFFLLVLEILTKDRKLIISPRTVVFLRVIILLVLVSALIEVVLDKKFVTADFRDNHREFIGLNIRRVSLSFQDPNYLAFHAGMVFLLLRFFSRKDEVLMSFCTLLVIFLTGSRGGILAIFISYVMFKQIKYIGHNWRYLVYFILIIMFFYSLKVLDMINSLPEMYLESSVDVKTIITRLILWTSAFYTIIANPLFGLGHGRISDYGKAEYLPFDLPPDVIDVINDMGFHNYWIELVVENGIIISCLLLYVMWQKRVELRPLVLFLFLFLFTSGYESPLLVLLFML